MEKTVYFRFGFLIGFAVFLSANALKCYKCAGKLCGDPFDKARATQLDCPGLCEKRKVSGFATKEAEANSTVKIGDVLRQCYSSTRKPGCGEEEKDGVKGIACYCDKPLCNGGSDVTVTVVIGAVIMPTWAVILTVFFG